MTILQILSIFYRMGECPGNRGFRVEGFSRLGIWDSGLAIRVAMLGTGMGFCVEGLWGILIPNLHQFVHQSLGDSLAGRKVASKVYKRIHRLGCP